jgi:hypothetical protein
MRKVTILDKIYNGCLCYDTVRDTRGARHNTDRTLEAEVNGSLSTLLQQSKENILFRNLTFLRYLKGNFPVNWISIFLIKGIKHKSNLAKATSLEDLIF